MSCESPFLQGCFAPWRSESNIDNLEIIGRIPEDLNGVLLRNGPNPQFDPVEKYHWFNGDGMIHAISLENGSARYYNRWIRTARFKLEKKYGRSLFAGGLTDKSLIEKVKNTPNETANTNIVQYNRQLLALCEGDLPVSIQLSNLATIGNFTYNGQIKRYLSAHPRYDYKMKTLYTYSYIDPDQRLMYYAIDRNNKVIAKKSIDWPYMCMVHDFVITENYIIFPLFPCLLSFERAMRGESPFMWEGDRLASWFIVTDKQGNEVGRFETDPCYVYHFGNAFETNGGIVIDAMHSKQAALFPDRNGNIATRENAYANLARYTLNLKNKTLNINYLDHTPIEFPRFDERFNGRKYQHLYVGGRSDAAELFDRIVHYDLENNTKKMHFFGDDIPPEPVFVPRSEKEGDGYLLMTVYRNKEDRSDLVVLDAKNIESEPLATIKIPHRIPFGFHGNFINK